MIDTDKYEGHTEGPWEFKHINSNWYRCDEIGEIHMEDIAIKEASANAQLIADAPLLLEEVKRLREKQIRYKNIVGEFDEFMCNNWTPDNDIQTMVMIHSLWNELFSKYPATREEEE